MAAQRQTIAPDPTGEGKDYGIALNLFDGKLVIRANQYETKQINASFGQSGTYAQRILSADFVEFNNGSGPKLNDAVRSWTESVTRCVESLVGVCVRRTVVETHRLQASGVTGLALRTTPVLSLVGVARTDGGPAYETSALDVDELGILTRLDGGRLTGRVRITTVAGRTVIPANIRDAGKLILQHLWRTKTGGSRAVLGGGEDYAVTEPIPGFGYAIPNRALQLLEPDRLSPEVG